LQELEFERGIWPAAMDGELSKVEKLIKSGVCTSAVDSSGYTALVRARTILYTTKGFGGL
jgi:hypothetical protein